MLNGKSHISVFLFFRSNRTIEPLRPIFQICVLEFTKHRVILQKGLNVRKNFNFKGNWFRNWISKLHIKPRHLRLNILEVWRLIFLHVQQSKFVPNYSLFWPISPNYEIRETKFCSKTDLSSQSSHIFFSNFPKVYNFLVRYTFLCLRTQCI